MCMYVATPRQRSPTVGPSALAKGAVAIDMGPSGSASTQSLEQLQLLTNTSDTAYLESRSIALQGIETTINELGSIYRQLATMISEQGEQFQRIDMNVEEMQVNLQRGQHELARYLRNMSSNRWLMIKIFALVIVFIIFWSIFLL